MKHIKVIIQELQKTGKYKPEVVMKNLDKKITSLEAESLIFTVLTNASKEYEPAVYISELLGDVVSKIQEEKDDLMTLRDTGIILDTLLRFISHNPFTSAKLTYLYLEAFETTDFGETVEHYLHYKNIFNNSEETL